MLIPEIKGLKFPDESLVRFFFKSGLSNIKESVLELGCGSGNNLRLFYEYGWDVTGVDLCATSLSDAAENFSSLQSEYNLRNNFQLIQDNMLNFFQNFSMQEIHTVLFPSSLFYLPYEDIVTTLELLAKKVKPGGFLFFKLLTDSDYRYHNANKVRSSNFSYKLKFAETGEYDQTVTFLSRDQWRALFEKFFVFEYLCIFDLNFEHDHKGVITDNANIICYGKLTS
jgi:SAM-dependent methyltransferase